MKVAVGLSGGVDSSVAAMLLRKQGHDVVGIRMTVWDDSLPAIKGPHACFGPDEKHEIESARRIAEKLSIPFHTIDVSREYHSRVLGYFKAEYLQGRTPNPCIRCNQHIKFSALLDNARDKGVLFDCFATGHYARMLHDKGKNRYILSKGRDGAKDQSYWLAFLSQPQLSRALFPLGEYTKEQVRHMARDHGLITSEKPDSQDFLSDAVSETLGITSEPGPIRDKNGTRRGTHKGICHYTIGQRKGLGIAAPHPLYVTGIDPENNVLIVGPKSDLARDELTASHINCVSIEAFHDAMHVRAKIRYTHVPAAATLSLLDKEKLTVTFHTPQTAVTPGQAIVFYDGDVLLGGAIIE